MNGKIKKTSVLIAIILGFTLSSYAKIDNQVLITRGWVTYKDFGAKGDGKTDDILSIQKAHKFANEHGLEVKSVDNSTYYIGGKDCVVSIRTNTDFGDSKFIIDDTKVESRKKHVFSIDSDLKAINISGITSLKKNQDKINISETRAGVVTVTDSTTKRYIRYGPNQNSGSYQTDIFLVDANGEIDSQTPIIWDFDQITAMSFLPIDDSTLIITGGHFTTIANREESKYNYYSRGFSITRSNVLIEGLEHYVIGEGDTGAPYGGFINISNCVNVAVRNTLLTGHKVYRTIGSAGTAVSMGTYDISLNRALNISFENCKQTNDINDASYWGIMGSNYCKNILYDNCTLSRFDAHMGVANAVIRNSSLGHQGINAIGSGIFTVENTMVKSRAFINLRSDYGSSWQGEFIIRNCTFFPTGVKSGSVNLINGYNSGKHDFGYECYMPEKITIENLKIEDVEHPAGYQGGAIFANFNKDMTDDTYIEEYPYIVTKSIVLKNVESASGKPLRLSDNTYIFKGTSLVK